MFVQVDRPMKLSSPLGSDALVLTAVRGSEAISELFRYDLDALWQDHKPLPFDQLLGQAIDVEVDHRSGTRFLHGIVARITQGDRDRRFTRYHLEVVPPLWLLTRRHQSRIFQHKTIPDILKDVLSGLNVTYQIQGTFEPREYCVQYRETDFNFISRLMEEEGIFYFFTHSRTDSSLVLANTPQSHPAIPYQSKVVYEEMSGHAAEEDRIYSWLKAQEIRSGKCVDWDDSFELPGKHLEAQKAIASSVQVGNVVHKLTAGGSSDLEIYDFPGGYAKRFDGVDKGGGDQAGELTKVFTDDARTVGIRMQQEALPALLIRGKSGHAGFTAGHAFELTRHFTDGGKFVITRVEHEATQPIGTEEERGAAPFEYRNDFECIPMALPYRPQRTSWIPRVHGVQTATVVGPPGEEIFTDKYGRVKVQFHWDRQGKNDADSSCWIRVGTSWAGTRWGSIHIPRIGQEVIVDFVEGDVDQPIIVGSVYNADLMPPYALPAEKTVSTLKSRSTKGGAPDNHNEFRFEDLKGKEQVFLQAERDEDVRVKSESRTWVGGSSHKVVDVHQKEKVGKNKHSIVVGDRLLEIRGNRQATVKGDVCETIGGARDWNLNGKNVENISGSNEITVGTDHTEKVGGKMSLTVGTSLEEKISTTWTNEAGMEIHLKAGMKVVIEAGMGLTLKGPGGFITINPGGIFISGVMVNINSGGAPESGSGASPASPASPKAPQTPEDPDPAVDGK